jgi:hypothetical protein
MFVSDAGGRSSIFDPCHREPRRPFCQKTRKVMFPSKGSVQKKASGVVRVFCFEILTKPSSAHLFDRFFLHVCAETAQPIARQAHGRGLAFCSSGPVATSTIFKIWVAVLQRSAPLVLDTPSHSEMNCPHNRDCSSSHFDGQLCASVMFFGHSSLPAREAFFSPLIMSV